jgi:tetratricopeptide (TPR) repeat protein
LTRDDLDELSDAAYDAAEPAAVAADLAGAADEGRLVDVNDTGYAYLLAAEIFDRAEAFAEALATVDRLLAVHRDRGDPEPSSTRAFRAELLLRLGRQDEGMAELEALRPLMGTSTLAAGYVPEALAAGGRPQEALRWVAETLAGLPADPDHPVVAQLNAVGDQLREAVAASEGDPAGLELDPALFADGAEAVLLVWPREEYELVDDRWPEVLEATGADGWDDYRRRLQAVIAEWRRDHRGPLWRVVGSADGFAEFLQERGADPADADLVALADRYGDELVELDEAVPMPPAPGDPCWCRSDSPYRSCCLPLSPR